MTVIEGATYLTPQEAGARLGISYRTLQRWADDKKRSLWVRTNGHRTKEVRPVELDVRFTPTGYRLYSELSIERLREDFNLAHAEFDEQRGVAA